MAKITLNGAEIEVDEGRQLVEVLKEQGVAITNLCYIDGLEPYAGCRTCLVNIEGAPGPPGIQLSCTSRTVDGMTVDTETPAVKQARQQVISLIDANHPDRCLTCHRRVHCMPGDICLRDDVVSHRCLTCAKNYRCELQIANEMLDMGEFDEPWVGEERSYYETAPPEPDRANPYLEFDPQMCIICTRCVRACADIRHTDAITLAGKGFQTRIAFGTGGAVHESDCDFCGACIDVCPTATLMEKPNKWVGRADEWVSSVCNSCSVGCTLAYGTAGGRPVIVRPDRINPVSREQICVRGRFGYTAVPERDRLTRSLARRGNNLLPVPAEEAVADAARMLTAVRREHGSDAIAVLGSPLATNEEAYLLARLAREALGTQHIDFSHGAVHRAVTAAFRDGLGSERLPASLTDVEQTQTIVVVGGDIEQSHQVISLRVKDAVVKRGAKLVLVSSRWGELVPFATAWLQPSPGHEAATVQALARALSDDPALAGQPPAGVDGDALATATETVQAISSNGEDAAGFAVVFAPDAVSSQRASDQARASANLAIAARGDEAASSLHYLPTDANVHGVADMGVAPGDGARSFAEIIAAAQAGEVRALVIHGDNPLLNAPGSDDTRTALESLDALVVIDSVRSTAGEHADVVLAELPFFARTGTLTNADRRVVRSFAAAGPRGEERPGIEILSALANALGGIFRYDGAADVTADIAEHVAGYVPFLQVASGRTRVLEAEGVAGTTRLQPVAAAGADAEPGAGLTVLTGRSLFTSWEGASIRSEQADQLHREESAVINPRDAEAAGVRDGDEIVLSDGRHELRIAARFDDGVAPGSVYVPHYYDAGAVMALFPLDGGTAAPRVQVRALQPA
ncbi:MAG: molybdopterin-dependent oxidoreductase [Dehalococcoidia bacterium]|jgi:predicted molibdopterin-dependent oxidoreductase YjgC|nr:molybdopterin-dependent oxidoreductase [Dehalococcoidia bacterium]